MNSHPTDDCGSIHCRGIASQAVDDGTVSSVAGFVQHLFDVSSYPPRWNCGEWTSLEGWLHIASDVGIFLAYFAIPAALVYFAIRRRDIPFNGLVLLFAAFILCCGTGHLLEAVIFYYPIYRVAGLMKFTTAIVSWVTVIALLRRRSRLLEIPTLASRNEALRQADLAKSAFLANMSHEIRTPMTAILGYADVLLDHTPPDAPAQQVDAARAIRRNGLHLLDIINDILDLSKVEAGGSLIEWGRCAPYAVVSEVVESLTERATAKGLTLGLQLRGDVPEFIAGDDLRLRQILFNVIGNAIKFTDHGGVRVAVSHRTKTPADDQIQFVVTDTGVGVPSDALETVFDPFTQVDVTSRRRHGGTGLGLAISRRLARAMGGDITVSSRLGAGSTFTVTIPARPAPAGESHDLIALSSSSAAPADSPVGGRVLLAEDGLDNQRLIAYLLNKAGIEVVLAENGLEAVQLATRAEQEERPFAVVLMDMQMPVLDGYEATRRLRNLGCQAKIIAITAHAMSGDREKCLAAGCDDYMTKPIDRHALVAAVRSGLAQQVPMTA